MGARARALATITALLAGACIEDLGATERKWACTSDDDCVRGYVCRPDPGGTGLSACLSEADPAACSFTRVDSASVGLPPNLGDFEAIRVVDPLGRGELALALVDRDDARMWLFEAVPGGFSGYVAARDVGLAPVFGDLDGDGDEDAWFFGPSGGPALKLNAGNHFHADVSAAWTLPPSDPSAFAVVIDAEGDGDLDVVSGGVPSAPGAPSLRLHRNDGGHVVEVTDVAGLTTKSWLTDCAVGDLDDDGDPDLVLSSYENGREIHVFRNDGDRFTRAEAAFGLEGPLDDSSGAALGDYDGDGDLDLLITNYRPQGAIRLQDTVDALFAATDGRFVQQTASLTGLDADGLDGLAGRFWDYDSDGDLDIVIGSYERSGLQVYRNEGGGRFIRTDAALGLEGTVVDAPPSFGDLDGDGDLDLVYDGDLYRNDCPTRGWVAIRAEVANPDGSWRVAIGARVIVDPARDGFEFPGSLLREVASPDNGYWLHVGLGDHRGPVDAKVVFPGPGAADARTVVFQDLPTQRRVTLRQDGSVASCAVAGRAGGCLEKVDAAACEIGYAGPECLACVAAYQPSGSGACVAPLGCREDGGWLAAGRLPADPDDERFIIGGDAAEPTVADLRTGLEWRRCPSGTSWDDVAHRCVPTAPYSVDAAESYCRGRYADSSDWRLPSLREMETLIDYSRQFPSLDLTAFAGADYAATYWTSTTEAGGGAQAILDVFAAATSWATPAPSEAQPPRWAMCVRGGGAGGRPRFVVHAADGSTVRDRWTGLEWTRCAVGQGWDEAARACARSPSLQVYADAAAACAARSDASPAFRLPTARELRSLRDFCAAPFFDADAFGLEAPLALWTSTSEPGAVEPRTVTVILGDASSASRAVVDAPGPALCVR